MVKVGVNLRQGQPLYVYGLVAHRRLIALLTEVAYVYGSGPVETRLFDTLQRAALIRHGRIEDIELCHGEDQAWFHEIVRHGGAYICLAGRESFRAYGTNSPPATRTATRPTCEASAPPPVASTATAWSCDATRG